jgi:transcriptional regulator with XRE-family HTH domain
MLGARIRARREAAGLTQQQLAARAELALSVLTKLEQGKATDPKLSTLRALARALGVTLDELVGPGDGEIDDK